MIRTVLESEMVDALMEEVQREAEHADQGGNGTSTGGKKEPTAA